ncbi:hypothetical protein ACJX0J_007418, partial [Zea mays]
MILFGLPAHFFALDEDVTNNSNFFKEKLTQALRESTAYYITCQWATEKKCADLLVVFICSTIYLQMQDMTQRPWTRLYLLCAILMKITIFLSSYMY